MFDRIKQSDFYRNVQIAFCAAAICLLPCSGLMAQTPSESPSAVHGSLQPADAIKTAIPAAETDYVVGPQDKLFIHVLDALEFTDQAYPIDLGGNLLLPRLGEVNVSGLTVAEVQTKVTGLLREYIKAPIVTVAVAEYHSQPVSVLGAVVNPGIQQIQGRKSLFEVISQAGGLKEDAGNSIKITRRMEYGPLPLPNAAVDASGRFSVAEVSVKSVVKAEDPTENIAVRPNDVITIPRAEMVYVIGAVHRPGGFTLTERSEISVLEALSLAEGLERTAGGKDAKILRLREDSSKRYEIPIDLNKVLRGKNTDTSLLANDILFIPSSKAKSVSLTALQTIVSTGSGIAMYHPF
jgi:polysaccharide export outer membrane protein